MTKDDLLKDIAETGYNVGFGAKRHFATYDITQKIPSVIGFVSIAVGIFALFIEALTAKWLSASLIILGVLAICISVYDQRKEKYAEVGSRLTGLFNRLRTLYYNVKGATNSQLPAFAAELSAIQAELGEIAICDQILGSNWYAHYKFFWEHQIEWVDEQKKFRFWRDKVPLTATAACLLTLLACIGLAIRLWQCRP
jgi:SMODS and SLOG-associating 2TM effector domain 6